MSKALEQLAGVVVRLQCESIRLRDIMKDVDASNLEKCYLSCFDDIFGYIDDASGTVTDIMFELYCAENSGTDD